jgi:glycosyltransferase involved in cell wall biosynthesis
MASPSFSIIVPTYQRRDMVCESLSALSKLTYNGPLEIIVVVNGSTDGTAEAVGRLDFRWPTRVVEIQPNRGPAGARNRGAAEATGDILLFLDDDMICEPDLVQQHARMYREGADAVAGNIPLHPKSPPGVLTDAVASAAVWEQLAELTPFEIYAGQLSVGKSVFDALGGFDEQFAAGGGFGNEDVEFGARLLERFDVRHNPKAISRQVNLVSARQFMDRAGQLAVADMRLAAKHPELGRRLFSHRAAQRSRPQRLAYRIFSASPVATALIASGAVGLCELALRTRFRSNPLLARAFIDACSIAYWSKLRRAAGPALVREFLRP